MRYIEKQQTEPTCLSEHKKECKELGLSEPFLYEDFHRTRELKSVLCLEQHNVCCYCQRPVKGFRIEHSYPENGPDPVRSKSLQLEYSNLFASCMDSQGNTPELQYCDVHKGNQIIHEFIKEEDCQQHFRYLSTGEIVPNGQYYTWKEYLESDSLTQDEQDARNAILVLNLNCHTLVDDRKKCIDSILELKEKRMKEEWQATLKSWLECETYPPYIELRIQYIEKYINSPL